MKKKFKFFEILVVGLLAFVAVGCDEGVIDNFQQNPFASNEVVSIASPKNVQASQGLSGRVELSWQGATNAKQYIIYSAASPFESFKKIGETKGNVVNFTVNMENGSNKWFKVQAVSTKGKKSDYSSYVFGCSMAKPLVLLTIDNSTAYVNWWMNNCDENSTYIDDVKFNISCINDNGTVIEEKNVEKTTRSVQFNNLEAKKTYYFEVKGFVGEDSGVVSDRVDSKTAGNQVPKSVQNLSITKGISKDEIVISWELPNPVDYYISESSMEEHPLYFTIERKQKDLSDKYYETIASYIGCVNTKAKTANKEYCFNVTDSTTSDSVLTIDANSSVAMSAYAGYAEGAILTFIDKNVVSNKQYEYRIRSYTDDVQNKVISSDTSVKKETGWLISTPTLNAEPEYIKNEGNTAFEALNVKFEFSFEDYDLDPNAYKYILTYIRTPLSAGAEADEEKVLKVSTSVEDVNFTKDYKETDLANESIQGKYVYKLYICNKDASNNEIPSSYYSMVKTDEEYPLYVTNDTNKIPEIENFSVEDGYKDKFIISWLYKSGCRYTLVWEDTTTKATSSLEINDSDLEFDGGNAKFTHSATSGCSRKYTLVATSELSFQKTYENESQTLGTAKVEKGNYSYDSIVVTWKPVQMADGVYTVSAKYEGETTELIDNKNIEVKSEEQDGLIVSYTYTITKPAGYNDATKSGKPIVVSVTAKNEKDSSVGSVSTKTFGPALVNLEAMEEQKNKIQMQWKEVEGAAGYVIYRVMYDDANCSSESLNDTYYYDVSTKELSRSGSKVKDTRATVSYRNGKFMLNDINVETTDSTDKAQGYISVGKPFGYKVIPVINGKDDYEDGKVVVTSDFAKNATYGYGTNVVASKADYSDKVVITWDKPFNGESKTAKLFVNDGNGWKITDKIIDSGKYETEVEYDSDDTNIYEYAVVYNQQDTSFTKSINYMDDLDKLVDEEDSESEKKNQGYLFSLGKCINAEYDKNNIYCEAVSWIPYSDDRKNRPTRYEIQVLNKNKSTGWTTIATMDANGTTAVQSEEIKNNTKVSQKSAGACTAKYEVVFDKDNGTTTSGQFMVLRDYKHYYRLVAYRTNSNGEEIMTSGNKNSKGEEVYAYRDITDEELCKCVNLIVADALYKVGIPNRASTFHSEDKRTLSGVSGSFVIKANINSGGDYKNQICWSMTNYKAQFNNGTSSNQSTTLDSSFVLNYSNSAYTKSCADQGTLYCLPSGEISVTHETGLASYQKTVSLTFGKTGKSTVFYVDETCGDNKVINGVTYSDRESFNNWVPYGIGESHNSSDYSLNSNFYIYQSPWWE